MDKDTADELALMLSTFSLTLDEAREKRVCAECGGCAMRKCEATASWTAENWLDWEMTAFCPTCITTEEDRVKRALDASERDNAERNWADITAMPRDWGNL